MFTPRIRNLLMVAALVVWYFALKTTWQLGGMIAEGSDNDNPAANRVAAYVDSSVQAALVPQATLSAKQYTGGASTPFLPVGRSSARRRTGARARPAQPQREELYLNGVLLRSSKPQVILEDQQGKTYILGVGDSVHNQKVVSITPDKVLLRYGRSTFPIQVRE